MKYSIIMPYIDRLKQFKRTLRSLDRYQRTDFEVILVEDAKNTDAVSNLTRPYLRHVQMEDAYYNPCVQYNVGAYTSKGEYFVLTNPECYHETDVLGEFDKVVGLGKYVVGSCRKADGWACHTRHQPIPWHFVSCINRFDYETVGGFDERFADGVAYEDAAFLHSVRELELIRHDAAQVFHQAHPKLQKNRKSLVRKNREIFLANYPKSAHKFLSKSLQKRLRRPS